MDEPTRTLDTLLGAEHPLQPALAAALQASIAPELATQRLQELFAEATHRDELLPVLAEDPPERCSMLVTILAQSALLTRRLLQHPSLLGWLLSRQTVRYTTSRELYRKELQSLAESYPPEREGAMALLRFFQQRETFRIGVRDILDIADMYTTALELSFLADVCIEYALAVAQEQLIRNHGTPRHEDGTPASLAVLALGKLGGEELNFSSDVDLVFVSSGDGETGGEADVAGARTVELERFFSRLATEVIALLSEHTPDGIAHRVDVRLRPEGRAGSLVRTLQASRVYFESFGEEWERQALLKARPVAGDRELGQRFIDAIQPFTYRKYVDEVAIAETVYNIRELRLKTFAKYPDDDALKRDVKNGPGGIRDVEFTVQAIQILFGGRYPEIRLPSTFRSLERIHQSGLLNANDHATLHEAYVFLRRVEHRIQMEEAAQVYAIPAENERCELLSRRLGFASCADFLETYQKHTRATHAIFNDIFFQEHIHDDVDVLLTSELSTEKYNESLEKYQLKNETWVPDTLRELCEDAQAPHLNTKLRRYLRSLLPRLLTSVRDAPDPALAVRNFAHVFTSVAANTRLGYFASLNDNPEALSLVVTIAGSSTYLTNLLRHDPSHLERMLSPECFVPVHTLEELAQLEQAYHPGRRSTDTGDEPAELVRLRHWTGWERLRIGVGHLLGLVESRQTYEHISLLAEFVLNRVLQHHVARLAEELQVDIADAETFGLSIVGLGKIGGRECTFGSDLDVVFVYDGEPDWYRTSTLEERYALEELYTRCATRLLRTMNQAALPGGDLFETDARLRPYGKNAPLVLTLNGYRSYYEERQETWERLMLTRVRLLCGHPGCGAAFETMAREAVAAVEWNAEVREAIVRMRDRIERAKPDDPLKAGYGGMIDVEFLAQAAQLRYSREHPAIQSPNVMQTLQTLVDADWYEGPDLAPVLVSYQFLRQMETALRVVDNLSLDALPEDKNHLRSLTRRVYLPQQKEPPPVSSLLDEYRACTHRIREAFTAFLGA